MFLQWARIIRSSLESKTSFDRECEPHLSQQQSYHKSSKTDQAVRMIDPHKQNLSNTVSVEAESMKLQKSRENVSLSSATLLFHHLNSLSAERALLLTQFQHGGFFFFCQSGQSRERT